MNSHDLVVDDIRRIKERELIVNPLVTLVPVAVVIVVIVADRSTIALELSIQLTCCILA